MLDLRPEHFQRVENREAFTNWLKGSEIESLDLEISTHSTYLIGKSLPASDLKEKEAALVDCIRRLEVRRLRQLKEEEGFRLAQMDPEEINQHADDILNINTEMEALFRSRSE